MYLYSLPSQPPPKLSFTLDGQSLSFHADTRSLANIYTRRNLINTRHTLLVTVEPESAFSFDYLIYTYEATPTIQLRQINSTDNPIQFSAQTPTPTLSPYPSGSDS